MVLIGISKKLSQNKFHNLIFIQSYHVCTVLSKLLIIGNIFDIIHPYKLIIHTSIVNRTTLISMADPDSCLKKHITPVKTLLGLKFISVV